MTLSLPNFLLVVDHLVSCPPRMHTRNKLQTSVGWPKRVRKQLCNFSSHVVCIFFIVLDFSTGSIIFYFFRWRVHRHRTKVFEAVECHHTKEQKNSLISFQSAPKGQFSDRTRGKHLNDLHGETKTKMTCKAKLMIY